MDTLGDDCTHCALANTASGDGLGTCCFLGEGATGLLTCSLELSSHDSSESPYAASTKILLRLCTACMVESLMPHIFFTKVEYSALAAATNLSVWDIIVFVRDLCLKKIVTETLSNCVIFTWII